MSHDVENDAPARRRLLCWLIGHHLVDLNREQYCYRCRGRWPYTRSAKSDGAS